MSNKIRVGIIGANSTRGWSQQSHIPALRSLPGFEITAVATLHQESADETASQLGVAHAYGDPVRLISDQDVDVVSVCVKVPHHYELVRAALLAGKHVFSEWPLATTTEEAVALAELARSRGLQTIVGLQGRKSSLANYVKDLIDEGFIGRVISSTLNLAEGGRGAPTVSGERIWALDRAAGANALTIASGHEIDVMRYCLGEFRCVSAMVETVQQNVTVLETGETISTTAPDSIFAQGVIVHESNPEGVLGQVAIRSGVAKATGLSFDIQGSSGALVISAPGSMHKSDVGVTLLGANGDEALATLKVPDRYRGVMADVPESPGGNVGGLYLDLADAIAGGVATGPTFETAVSLHRLLDAIQTASDSGQRQLLD